MAGFWNFVERSLSTSFVVHILKFFQQFVTLSLKPFLLKRHIVDRSFLILFPVSSRESQVGRSLLSARRALDDDDTASLQSTQAVVFCGDESLRSSLVHPMLRLFDASQCAWDGHRCFLPHFSHGSSFHLGAHWQFIVPWMW